MARRTEQPDHYALLQVTPGASRSDIAAAYARLSDLYSADRTASAAPELQSLAAAKRDEIERAYAVLSDADRRAAYDRQYGFAQGEADAIDYRPLPPAHGAERTRRASDPVDPADAAVPRRKPQARGGVGRWLIPLGVASVLLALLLAIVINPIRVNSGAVALATPTLANVALPFSAAQLAQFRTAAEGGDTAQLWAALGNAQFDNLQTMRENARLSPQYQGQIAAWLDVIAAYDRSLALADDPTVRSSRAVALMTYGVDAQDAERVAQALAEVERGIAAGIREPRALLNYGFVFALATPPRTDDAIAQWRTLIETAPDAPEAQVARGLLQRYGAA